MLFLMVSKYTSQNRVYNCKRGILTKSVNFKVHVYTIMRYETGWEHGWEHKPSGTSGYSTMYYV